MTGWEQQDENKHDFAYFPQFCLLAVSSCISLRESMVPERWAWSYQASEFTPCPAALLGVIITLTLRSAWRIVKVNETGWEIGPGAGRLLRPGGPQSRAWFSPCCALAACESESWGGPRESSSLQASVHHRGGPDRVSSCWLWFGKL